MSRSKLYAPIDIHKATADGWPAEIPALTEPEALRAARRLWRYSVGSTFTGVVKVTSGNRRNRIGWAGNKRCIFVNPSRGWKNFIHELSHWFDYVVNGSSEHGKHHARFEAKLVREVVRRGYLDGKLRDPEPEAPEEVPAATRLEVERRKKLAALQARMTRWESKLKRAENALAKLRKSSRYYEKALGATE
jgi:hypothetical protein